MDYTSGMLGEDNPMLGTGSSTNHYSSTASIDNERLMARIAELERDNQVLHERARQATSPSSTPMYVPPPTVNVSYPNPPPRLGIFTGQKPLCISLLPGEDMTLTGQVLGDRGDSKIRLLPRPDDSFPPGLQVYSHLEENTAFVCLNNVSKHPIQIDHSMVFAEIFSTQHIPLEALVGPSLRSSVNIEGITCPCLIDSGSQVTMMSHSLYQTSFGDFPLHDVSTLNVMGAGGKVVPYLGYISVNVHLDKDTYGLDVSPTILILICPDSCIHNIYPVILGTNVLRYCVDAVHNLFGQVFDDQIDVCSAMTFIYRDLPSSPDGKIGSVQVYGQEVTIPPGKSLEVKCESHSHIPFTRDDVLIHEPVSPTLPEGLRVVSCLVPVTQLSSLEMVVINDTDEPITLKKRTTIGDIYFYDCKYNIDDVLTQLAPNESDITATAASTHVNPDTTTPPPPDSTLEFKFGRKDLEKKLLTADRWPAGRFEFRDA